MAERDRRPRGERKCGGVRGRTKPRRRRKGEMEKRDKATRSTRQQQKREQHRYLEKPCGPVPVGIFTGCLRRNCHLMYIVVKRERPHANKSMSFNGP